MVSAKKMNPPVIVNSYVRVRERPQRRVTSGREADAQGCGLPHQLCKQVTYRGPDVGGQLVLLVENPDTNGDGGNGTGHQEILAISVRHGGGVSV